jgi:hypothetical protein
LRASGGADRRAPPESLSHHYCPSACTPSCLME